MNLAFYNSNYFWGRTELFHPNDDILHKYWTKSTGVSEKENGLFNLIETFVCVKYKQEEYSKDFIRHFRSYLQKWENKPDAFKETDKYFVTGGIKEILDYIIPLEPTLFTFDLTEDRSIFFKIYINQFNIYLELFLEPDTSEFEAILNIYQDKVNIYAFGGEISAAIDKIKEIALSNSISHCDNELSETFIT